MYDEHEIVELTEDYEKRNLFKGDRGVIVYSYRTGAYEVEFQKEGMKPVVLTLRSYQIRKA